MSVTITQAGMRAILASPEMRKALEEAAEQVADNVRARGIRVGDVNGGPDEVALPVEVSSEAGAAYVTLAHPAGNAVQAKHGALTRAAAEAGLDVRTGSR